MLYKLRCRRCGPGQVDSRPRSSSRVVFCLCCRPCQVTMSTGLHPRLATSQHGFEVFLAPKASRFHGQQCFPRHDISPDDTRLRPKHQRMSGPCQNNSINLHPRCCWPTRIVQMRHLHLRAVAHGFLVLTLDLAMGNIGSQTMVVVQKAGKSIHDGSHETCYRQDGKRCEGLFGR